MRTSNRSEYSQSSRARTLLAAARQRERWLRRCGASQHLARYAACSKVRDEWSCLSGCSLRRTQQFTASIHRAAAASVRMANRQMNKQEDVVPSDARACRERCRQESTAGGAGVSVCGEAGSIAELRGPTQPAEGGTSCAGTVRSVRPRGYDRHRWCLNCQWTCDVISGTMDCRRGAGRWRRDGATPVMPQSTRARLPHDLYELDTARDTHALATCVADCACQHRWASAHAATTRGR